MNSVKSILFVCTGNSCRSVMAEGLMKKYLKSLGQNDITVRSAGVRALDGYSPTDETIEVMGEEGVDMSGFRSSAITEEAIKGADLILAMGTIHKNEVIRCVPEASAKTFLLKEYGRTDKGRVEETDVPDPIGQSLAEYKTCLETIKREIERVAKMLSASL